MSRHSSLTNRGCFCDAPRSGWGVLEGRRGLGDKLSIFLSSMNLDPSWGDRHALETAWWPYLVLPCLGSGHESVTLCHLPPPPGSSSSPPPSHPPPQNMGTLKTGAGQLFVCSASHPAKPLHRCCMNGYPLLRSTPIREQVKGCPL